MLEFSASKFPIVIVDDESETLHSYSVILKSMGIRNVVTIEDGREVMPLLEREEVALVMLDLYMPNLSGNELLSLIKYHYPHIPVIVMTAANEIETAVECMKAGAFDYLVKPVEKNRLVSSIKRVFELRQLEEEVNVLKQHLLTDRLNQEEVFSPIVTRSNKMLSIFRYMESIAQSGQPVMVTGETGVGKELVARAIHDASGRKGKYVAVNIAGLDDVMFSDALFGHRKGAFTGAEMAREGLIHQAAGGTLFIDEIGDLQEQSQVKLLRLLQNKEYYPLGSDLPRKSEARIVVATNRDVPTLMAEGRFRKDLFFRLRTHHIAIPPLRERIEDIPLLLDHFLEKASAYMRKKKPTPPAELIKLLSTYSFPGNIRELEGLVYDAVARHNSGILSMASFKNAIGSELPPATGPEPEQILPDVNISGSLMSVLGRFPTLKEVEDIVTEEAMRHSGDNQGIAASLLGVTRQALNKRLTRRR